MGSHALTIGRYGGRQGAAPDCLPPIFQLVSTRESVTLRAERPCIAPRIARSLLTDFDHPASNRHPVAVHRPSRRTGRRTAFQPHQVQVTIQPDLADPFHARAPNRPRYQAPPYPADMTPCWNHRRLFAEVTPLRRDSQLRPPLRERRHLPAVRPRELTTDVPGHVLRGRAP